MRKFTAWALVLSFLLTIMVTMPLTVSADDGWTEKWSFSGAASVNKGNIVISPDTGATASAYKRYSEVSEASFDVEFTMRIENFGKSIIIELCTGKYRVYMTMNEGGFTYLRDPGHGGGTGTVSTEIGYAEHTYRLTGEGNKCEIYIDEYYVDTIYIAENATFPSLWFNAGSESRLIITHATAYGAVKEDPEEEEPEEEEPEEVVPIKPEPFAWEFDGNDDLSGIKNFERWTLDPEAGTIHGIANGLKYNSSTYEIKEWGDDFVFETRLKVPQIGHNFGFSFYWDHWVTLYMFDRYCYASVLGGSATGGYSEIIEGDKWYDFKFETYNNGDYFRVYINEKVVMDKKARAYTGSSRYLYFFTAGYGGDVPGEILYDYMRFTPIVYPIHIEEPVVDSVYMSGQTINLSATVEEGADIPYVDYKINGQVIATGQAPDYKASVTSLPTGNYQLTAEYQDKDSGTIPIEVLKPIEGKLEISETGQDSIRVSVQELHDENNRVSEVEYLLDGVSVGKSTEAPFAVDVKNLTNEAHTVTAVFKNNGGMVLLKKSEKWIPTLDEGETTVNYSNELLYNIEGSDGEAIVNVSNGNHALILKHTKDDVVYQSDKGEQTYHKGIGKFQILTDGPYAEVYVGGQLAFSYLMPRTDKIERNISENGLLVKDFSLTIPEVRTNHFVKKNIPVGEAQYPLSDLGYYHNLDFVADSKDQGEIAVNDGIYWTKLILENGKIYVWTVINEAEAPYKTEIGTMPEGTAYYRVDISLGMSRIYADGKFIASFRSILSMGEPQLGIQLTGGDGLDYLAVNDYTDLYFHNDDFHGEGNLDSLDYWRLSKNMQKSLDKELGLMTFISDGDRGSAEMNAYAGDMTFSADVKLNECDGGFWFTFGKTLAQWYNKVGYNAETGKMEIVEVRGNSTSSPSKVNTIKEIDGELPLNKTIHIDLTTKVKAATKEIIFMVDGETIFHEDVPQRQAGMFGFMISKGSFGVSNVTYRGDAKPMVSMTDTSGVSTPNTLDAYEVDGTIFMPATSGTATVSENGGKSWGSRGIGGGEKYIGRNVILLQNGDLLTLRRTKMGTDENGVALYSQIASSSSDLGASWTQYGPVQESPYYNRDQMAGRLSQGPSGRVYYMSFEGKSGGETYMNSRVYYSDDMGKTWTASQTDIDGREMGFAINEVTVHELSSGVVRATLRNSLGFLVHWDSYDGGVTFEKKSITTPFFVSQNCFGFVQDPADPDTFYVAWSYDNANLAGMHQYPRTRVSVAKSTDGCLTWEYLGTIWESNSREQTNCFMNANLDVGNQYLVFNACAMAEIESKNEGGRYIVFDKKKQVATKRFERLHHTNDDTVQVQRLIDDATQNSTMVINKSNNQVILGGEPIFDGYDSGSIPLDCAAALVHANVEFTTDGGATLQNGNVTVSLEADTLSHSDGKYFVKLDVFVQKFELKTFENDDVIIVGKSDQWEVRQERAFRLAADLFTDNL